MITPSISLVAYADREPHFVFVKIPNERGRYVRTDMCVILVPCELCGATVGEPCFRNYGVFMRGKESGKRYGAGTHATRRQDADRRHGGRGDRDVKPHYRACVCGDHEMLHEGTQ